MYYFQRPLHIHIALYLEDTLAEQCLSKTLYPNTKIIVSRKKVEGTLLTYTNELEVEIDFSDVDPNLLEDNVTYNENKADEESNLLSSSSKSEANSNENSSRFFKKSQN